MMEIPQYKRKRVAGISCEGCSFNTYTCEKPISIPNCGVKDSKNRLQFFIFVKKEKKSC